MVPNSDDLSANLCEKSLMQIIRFVNLFLYYVIVRKLPNRYFPLGHLISRFRGKFVTFLLGSKCGSNLELEANVFFGKFDDVKIGNNVQINQGCTIRNVQVGNDVMIAPNANMIYVGHSYDQLDVSMRFQPEKRYPQIIIEDNVWIGMSVIILPGINIGTGSIVAAGSVVTKNVPPFSIVGGNPATFIRKIRE